jgi:hypothetical protein
LALSSFPEDQIYDSASRVWPHCASGHHWDLRFLATATVVGIWHRFFKRNQFGFQTWPAKISGLTGPIRAGFKSLGWKEIRDEPWSWTHEGIDASFSLNPRLRSWCDDGKLLRHQLRESWRFLRFEK